MADTFRVRIDVAKLRDNLASADDPVTDAEAREFLTESGFRPLADDWWECEEISLESLDRSEILDQRHQK